MSLLLLLLLLLVVERGVLFGCALSLYLSRACALFLFIFILSTSPHVQLFDIFVVLVVCRFRLFLRRFFLDFGSDDDDDLYNASAFDFFLNFFFLLVVVVAVAVVVLFPIAFSSFRPFCSKARRMRSAFFVSIVTVSLLFDLLFFLLLLLLVRYFPTSPISTKSSEEEL